MNFVWSVALAGILSTFALTSADAANRKVDIINNTGKEITEFYASNTKTQEWEEDILGRDILAPGEEVEVDIDDGTGACTFDFKAVFSDGSSRVREKVNVCEISRYTYR